MNNTIKNAVLLSLAAASSAALADGWVFFDRQEGTWRVNGGAVMDFGVKTRLHTNQRQTYTTPFVQGDTAANAERLANGVDASATRKVYPNGAWIDMADPGIDGDMSGKTGYYYFPGGPGENNNGSVFSLGSRSFSEVTSYGERAGSVDHYDGEDAVVPGFGLELARTLYRSDEYHFGVDLAFGFQYFFRRSVWRDSSSWTAGSSVYEGNYAASVDVGDAYDSDDPREDWNWHTDSSGNSFYGSGEPSSDSFEGYAGPISGGSVMVAKTDGWRHDSSYGSMDSKADYENIEFLFLARPWYDVTDWLRVIGTLGFVVSRQSLDFTTTMMRDGVYTNHSRDFNDWGVYGVAGLGLAVHYKGFTLGVDAFARFLHDDLDVDDTYVQGRVTPGNWVGRLTLGYSF